MSGRERGRNCSRRSCCLSIVGVALFLIVAAAGAFSWFYSHPISNDMLHQRVLRRLERISGLNVVYDTAALRLSTGQYTITNLRFMDPAHPEFPVLAIGEVLATIRPWQLLSNPESVLTRVILKNPSRLDLVYSVDSIRLGERTQFLVEAVKKAQPPGSNSSDKLPFDELKIENAEVAFTEEEGILPDPVPAEAAMLMRGDIDVTNVGESGLEFSFSGSAAQPSASETDDKTSPTMASGLVASLILDGSSLVRVKGEAERISLNRMFREMPETAVRAADLVFDVSADADGADRLLKGNLQAAAIAYNNPEKGIVITDEAVDLAADLNIDTSASLMEIRSLSLDSAGALASVSGTAVYGPQNSYDLSLAAERIAKDYRKVLEQFLPAGWNVEAARNSLAVDLHIAGGAGIEALNGTLAVRGITVQSPALPAALKNLNGNVEFARDSMKFVDVTAEYAGAGLAIAGELNGDLWKGRAGTLDMSWSTVLSLEQVLKLHGNQLVSTSQPVSGSGVIRGHGTWKQAVDLENPANSGMPGVEGEIELQDVSFNYPGFPAPVAGLSGKSRITDNRLEVSNLTGKMQGSEMSVDGQLVGDKYFWRDPTVSASLTSRLDLAKLGPYLTTQQKANLDKYQLTGKARTEMVVNGPLNDLGSRLTGVMHIAEVSFTPDLDFMHGNFTGVSGVLTWDGRLLRLDDVTGLLNNETVELKGDISAAKVDLHISSSPSLATVQKTFPYLDKYLEMSGDSLIDLNFNAGDESTPGPGNLAQVLEAASTLADTSVAEKTFSLNGTIKFDDAAIRHVAMPVARKENGRAIPAGKVTGMKGTLLVKNDMLTVPENATISCAFADTSNCRLSGTIKIRPNHFPAMNVKISSAGLLKLDTWIPGWGKGLPVLAQPPMTGSKFDLEAEIFAPSVVFRGQQAGRSRAKILFHMTQNETPRMTEFRDVVIQGNQPGQGRIIGSGRIESFVWNKQQFPRWQTSLDVQSMPLENMLTAVFQQPSNIRGMASGTMDLQGVSNNPRTVQGSGSSFMQNLEIGGTAVIQQLGQTTGRNFGGMLFQTARAATFNVGNGALSSRDLALETNGLMLEMRGDYWFTGDPVRGIAPRTIDGNLRLRLFKSVFGNIPIVGQVAELADEVTNAFLLAFRVTGTATAPRVTPVPLPVFQGGG